MQVKITWYIERAVGAGTLLGNVYYDEENFHICDLTEANGHIKELLDNGFKVTIEPYYGDEE